MFPQKFGFVLRPHKKDWSGLNMNPGLFIILLLVTDAIALDTNLEAPAVYASHHRVDPPRKIRTGYCISLNDKF